MDLLIIIIIIHQVFTSFMATSRSSSDEFNSSQFMLEHLSLPLSVQNLSSIVSVSTIPDLMISTEPMPIESTSVLEPSSIVSVSTISDLMISTEPMPIESTSVLEPSSIVSVSTIPDLMISTEPMPIESTSVLEPSSIVSVSTIPDLMISTEPMPIESTSVLEPSSIVSVSTIPDLMISTEPMPIESTSVLEPSSIVSVSTIPDLMISTKPMPIESTSVLKPLSVVSVSTIPDLSEVMATVSTLVIAPSLTIDFDVSSSLDFIDIDVSSSYDFIDVDVSSSYDFIDVDVSSSLDFIDVDVSSLYDFIDIDVSSLSDFILESTSHVISPSPTLMPLINVISGLHNMTANLSGTVMFYCSFSGVTSDFDITWFQGGSESSEEIKEELNNVYNKINITTVNITHSIEGGIIMTSFLTISNVTQDDEGYYVCSVEEDYLESEGYFTVQVPPLLLAVEDVIEALESDNVTFEVIIQEIGSPPINSDTEIEWTFTSFSGQIINNLITGEDNVDCLSHNITFTLSNCTSKDRGNYTMTLSHSTGIYSITFELVVIVVPRINILEGLSIITNISQDIEITCEIESYPSIEDIEWYLVTNSTWILINNQSRYDISYTTVSNDTSSTVIQHSLLRIDMVELSDEGQYQCVALPQGVNTSFTITVQFPPVLKVSDNTPLIGLIGGYITFQFNISDVGSPSILNTNNNSIQWFFNDTTVIQDGTNNALFNIAKDSVVSLTLFNLSLSDEGNYTVVISNPAGYDSSSLFLDVEGMLVSKMYEITYEENDNATIEFEIEYDAPYYQENSFMWYFTNLTDNTFIISTNHVTFMEHYKLSSNLRVLAITSVSLQDRGEYTLYVTNNRSATVKLDVKIQPKLIYTHGSDANRNILGNVSFNCSATGVPPPTISWLRNYNTVLFNSTRVNIITTSVTQNEFDLQQVYSVLNIMNLRVLDTGHYLCRAGNSFGPIVSLNTPYNLNVNDNRPPPFCEVNTDYCDNGKCINLPDDRSKGMCQCRGKYTGEQCDKEATFSLPITMNTVDIFYGGKKLQVITTSTQQETITHLKLKLQDQLTLVCSFDSIPQPQISWYSMNNLNHTDAMIVANSSIYQLPEVNPDNRGYYYCNGSNNKDTMKSRYFLVNITGVKKYRTDITTNKRDREQFIQSLNRNITGIRIGTVTILSIERLTASSGLSNRKRRQLLDMLKAVITLYFEEESNDDDKTEQLVNTVQETLREQQGINITVYSRYDGCPRENYSVEAYSLLLQWPETNFGDTSIISCPCGNIDLSSTGVVATRECAGSYGGLGATWAEPNYSKCKFSNITRKMCDLASRPSDEKIEELGSLTENSSSFQSQEVITASTILLTAGNDASGNLNLTKGYLSVINNIASVNVTTLRESQRDARVTTKLIDSIQNVSDALPTTEDSQPVVILEESFVILVQQINNVSQFSNRNVIANQTGSRNVSINIVSDSNQNEGQTASLLLPPNLFLKLNNNGSRDVDYIGNNSRIVTSAFPRDSPLFITSDDNEYNQVGSIILSASVAGEDQIENLTDPTVDIEFEITNTAHRNDSVKCVYWNSSLDNGFGGWSSEGCTVDEELYESDPSRVVCHCEHLTTFTILLDLEPLRNETLPTDVASTVLSTITYIGCVMSIICLLVTIVTFLSVKKLRKSIHGQLLLHLCIALTGLYFFFILASFGSINHFLCSFIGMSLQYFFLVSFMLMAAEAVILYFKLVIVLGATIPYFVLKAGIISWIMSVFIVVFCFAPNYHNYYGPFCRAYDVPFYIGTIVPFALIYIFNWTIFTIIIVSLTCRSCKRQYVHEKRNSKMTKLRQQLKAAIVLSFLFGLSWGLGIPASTKFDGFTLPEVLRKSLEFAFIALNAFQGFAVFLLQCFNSSDVKMAWRSLYNNSIGHTSIIGRITSTSNGNSNNTKSDIECKDNLDSSKSNGHDSTVPMIVVEEPSMAVDDTNNFELETCFHENVTTGIVLKNHAITHIA